MPFSEQHAVKAAEFFRFSGRKRHLKVDAMIAATAVFNEAHLATNNKADF